MTLAAILDIPLNDDPNAPTSITIGRHVPEAISKSLSLNEGEHTSSTRDTQNFFFEMHQFQLDLYINDSPSYSTWSSNKEYSELVSVKQ